MRRTIFAYVALCGLSLACFGGTVFTTDFESGAPPQLSGFGSLVSVAGFPVSAGLGANAWQNTSTGDPAAQTLINLTGLDPHTWLRVDFDFIAYDSWDGTGTTYGPDYLNLVVGASSSHASVSNFPAGIHDHGTAGPFVFSSISLTLPADNNYGGNSAWTDSVWHRSFRIPHTANTAVLSFYAYGAGWQGGDDESFGLDNIVVQTDDVPEPATFSVLGLGLLAFAALRRRR